MIRLYQSADEEARKRDDWEAEAAGEVLVREGVGVVILRENVEESTVDGGFGVVELRDIAVFEGVNQHFASQDKDKGLKKETRPGREDSESFWIEATFQRKSRIAGSRGAKSESAGFNEITKGDDGEHQPELEALDDVSARELEQVLLFEFLENCRLDLHELIRHEQSQEGIGIRIDGDVQRDDLEK